jgi:hypothetical protein
MVLVLGRPRLFHTQYVHRCSIKIVVHSCCRGKFLWFIFGLVSIHIHRSKVIAAAGASMEGGSRESGLSVAPENQTTAELEMRGCE